MSAHLILLRHGESEANRLGLFTGALDVPLTPFGREQSLRAAEILSRQANRPSRIICSPLSRARATAEIVATHAGHAEMSVDCRLTERSYGALTGRTKSDVIEEYGVALFREWRRSLDQAPPPMPPEQLRQLQQQAPLRDCSPGVVRETETLAEVIARIRPLLAAKLVPALRSGSTVLVVAHGNSLRALVAVIDHLGDADLRQLNIPAAEPLVYRVDRGGQPVAGSGAYLDPLAARAAARAIAEEGGT